MQQLKNIIKRLYAAFMWHSGLLFLWLALRPSRHHVTILNYHRIHPRIFEQHLRRLTRAYNIVTLDACCLYLQGRAALPANSLVLTFDDGLQDFYHHICPRLKSLLVPATLFLPTGPIDHRDPLWFNRVRAAVRDADTGVINLGSHPIRLNGDRHEAYLAAVAYLNELPVVERDRLLQALTARSPLDSGHAPDDLPLSWDQIHEMSGLVDFGAHTVTHPNLAVLSREEAAREINASKTRIEQQLGREVNHFAYPFGARRHFTPETKELLREARLQSALTTVRGSCAPGDDMLALKRVPVDGALGGRATALRVSGLWFFWST
jgi:peptidoglycan/xylan/chitin deacetylase (PgdA/CDA1 family)